MRSAISVFVGMFLAAASADAATDFNAAYGRRPGQTPLGDAAGAAIALAGQSLLAPKTANDAAQKAQFSPGFRLIEAIQKSDYREIRFQIGQGASPNSRDTDGTPALLMAADMNDASLVKYLLEQHASVNLTARKDGETALMRAARHGCEDCVKVIIAFGADLNLVNRNGDTALLLAVHSGNGMIVRLLAEAGADTSLQDYAGRSALDYARDRRANDMLRVLESGPKPAASPAADTPVPQTPATETPGTGAK